MSSVALRRALIIPIAVMSAIVVTAASPRQQPANAAVTADPITEAKLKTADQLHRARRFDEAIAAYQSTLDAAQLSGNVQVEGWSLIGIGNVFLSKAMYPQARDYALRGLEFAERVASADRIGRANLILSVAAQFMGDRVEARMRAERSLAAFENSGDLSGRSQATLAFLRMQPAMTPDTERLFERAVADAREAGDQIQEASAYHEGGDALFVAGNYARALSMLEQAATLYSKAGDGLNLGTVYNSVGRVYRAHGQLQTALEYQLKALALHEASPNAFLKMQSLNAVSAVYQMLDEPAKAKTYVERALTVAEQTGSPRIQDFLRANLANILAALGEYGRAAELLKGVIERDTDSYVTERYTQLSNALRQLGNLDEALRAAETAVARCLEQGADGDCTYTFIVRAQAQLAKGDRSAASRDISTALEGIESKRTKLLPSDFFKREFVRSQEAAYTFAIDVMLQQGHAEEALETAELARSRAFIDLLASRELNVKPPGPAPLPAPAVRGSAPSFAPRDMSSLAIAPPARAADLAAAARRLKSTLLAYWTTGDAVFIWVVTPDGHVRSARVDVLASRLTALLRATVPLSSPPAVGATKTVVATRGGEEFSLDAPRTDAWRDLYDLLIKPIRSALPTTNGSLLTVIPHGALAGLPFAALRDERGRYLIEDFTLHYAPAGAVLKFTEGMRRADGRKGSILIVADPVVPKQAQLGRPLPSLPGAREEARAISEQVPAARRTVLIGAEATEVRVAAAVEKTAVVHFATHAVARDNAPFESFLALGADGASDGLMTAEEVYRLHLHADLVMLSACRSGGARVTGDGISTFARAFIYAGTPSIIASLWDVPDVSTSALVSNFYREWLAGASKSRALRSAQLAMLRDLRLGRITAATAAGPVAVPEHPIFWAGLVLIGEPD